VETLCDERKPYAPREYFKKKSLKGDRIGGPKRMSGMTEEQRGALAKMGSSARWGKEPGEE